MSTDREEKIKKNTSKALKLFKKQFITALLLQHQG